MEIPLDQAPVNVFALTINILRRPTRELVDQLHAIPLAKPAQLKAYLDV